MGGALLTGSALAAFLAGMVAFFAPCCAFVMLPIYLASVTGASRWRTAALTAVFIAGVATVVWPPTVGAAGLSQLIAANHETMFIAGGLMMVAVGAATLSGWMWHGMPAVGGGGDPAGVLGIYGTGVFAGSAEPFTQRRVGEEVGERVRERIGVAGRYESAAPRGQDVLVARDGGGDDRNALSHRLGDDDAEALAPQRGRAEHVGAPEQQPPLAVGKPAVSGDSARLICDRARAQELVPVHPDQVEADALRKPVEGGQQHVQPFARFGAPDEEYPPLGAAGRDSDWGLLGARPDAVRDHGVDTRHVARADARRP